MKGTKVLTLGEGISYTHVDACDTCVRMRGTAISGLVQLVVAYHLAESQSLASYTTR